LYRDPAAALTPSPAAIRLRLHANDRGLTVEILKCRGARIGNLPVQHLALSAQACEQLATAGIRNIGLLLELPRDALAKRFGTEMCDYLARLTGQAPDPRPTFHPPAHYDARFDFDFELRNSEALLFPLQRMLRELAGFLRAMDACVPSFELIFEHREQAPTALRIGLSIPERSPEKLLTLVREHLARTVLAAPTIGLRLIAHELVASSARQSDLFSSALQETEALAHTLDKLVARLGESHVFGLQCIADHRPERAWRKARPDEKRSGMAFPERPLWLLQQPKPLQLASPPMLVAGPERIESGWWDGADVQRDYYVLCTDEHAKLWAYRDHERNGEWYLHGFWA
jgi:protein ImuB